jgi:hypothetical protein
MVMRLRLWRGELGRRSYVTARDGRGGNSAARIRHVVQDWRPARLDSAGACAGEATGQREQARGQWSGSIPSAVVVGQSG